MIQAFKPKRFIFLHCCANCEYAKKVIAFGTAKNYICTKEDHGENLSGTHFCDVDINKVGEQMSWLDDLEDMIKEAR